MRITRLTNPTRLLLLTALTGCLTGCYTQLYTRGYADRALDQDGRYASNAHRPRPAADTLSPSSSTLQAGEDPEGKEPDSTLGNGGNTLGDGANDRSSTVIVNNYYPDQAYYRGYSTLDWDYPYISFGFYSSRYRDYWDPYWWHGRGYGGGYGHGYDRGFDHGGVSGGQIPGGNSGGNGAYHSGQRLFTPTPDYPQLKKGRRAEEPKANPAPQDKPAPEQTTPSQPAPKSDANQGSEDKQESHPALKKGRR